MNEESKSFINDVKSGKIKHPTQFGFSENKWKNAYKKHENVSESDKNLFFAGLWFDKYFHSIRSELVKYDDKIVDLIKLRQMYVATTNRDFCVADTAIKEHLKQESDKEKQIIMGAIAEKKLPIGPDDYNVHVFGAIESSLNALRFPLSETFQKVESTNKNLDDLEILNILIVRINLASTYSLISNMWHECLWNKWVIDNSSEKFDLIRPSKSKEHLCRIISEHRFEALSAEFSYHTINLWNQLPDKIKEIEKNKLRVVAIEKKGKRKVIKLSANSDEGVIIPELSMAVAAEEQYWDQILVEPLPNYPDLTLTDMVQAWRILSSLGRVLKSRAPSDTGVTRVAKLIQFAPKLRINELISAIRKATNFTYKQATSIIDHYCPNVVI